jgi:hypothetical protein
MNAFPASFWAEWMCGLRCPSRTLSTEHLLEQDSKKYSLLGFKCVCRVDDHTSCVQNPFLGTIHPRGGEPRKPNIAAEDAFVPFGFAKSLKKLGL